MDLENCQILKTLKVTIKKGTKIGDDTIETVEQSEIELPAGTLLQGGNVRIPIVISDDNPGNLNLYVKDLEESSNNTNQYYLDNSQNLYACFPSKENTNQNDQVTVCKVLKDTNLIMNKNKLKFRIEEEQWFALFKGTEITIPENTEIEFRVNGSWYKVKTSKKEFFTI